MSPKAQPQSVQFSGGEVWIRREKSSSLYNFLRLYSVEGWEGREEEEWALWGERIKKKRTKWKRRTE